MKTHTSNSHHLEAGRISEVRLQPIRTQFRRKIAAHDRERQQLNSWEPPGFVGNGDFTVEEVFLIDAATGRLMVRESADEEESLLNENSQLLSGTIAAVRSFATSLSSRRTRGRVENAVPPHFSVGGYTISVVTGHQTIVAAFGRGVPPAEYGGWMWNLLHELAGLYGGNLIAFDDEAANRPFVIREMRKLLVGGEELESGDSHDEDDGGLTLAR